MRSTASASTCTGGIARHWALSASGSGGSGGPAQNSTRPVRGSVEITVPGATGCGSLRRPRQVEERVRHPGSLGRDGDTGQRRTQPTICTLTFDGTVGATTILPSVPISDTTRLTCLCDGSIGADRVPGAAVSSP